MTTGSPDPRDPAAMMPDPLMHVLRDGSEVWVRPVERGDAEDLQRAFTLLTEQSRYQRFLTGMPALGDRLAEFFTDVDHVHHEALVVFPTNASRSIVGVARYIRHADAPDEADLALTIAEHWQGRGLSTLLVGLLSRRARDRGIRRFTVDTLADNPAMIALVRSAGGVSVDVGAGVVSGLIDLGPVDT